MADILIAGASYSDVPAILIPKNDESGNASFIDENSLFKYGGRNGELVDTFHQSYTLDDTSFVIGTTAPSSATSIKATVAKAYTGTSMNWNNYDAIVVQTVVASLTHSDDAVNKAKSIKCINMYVTHIAKTDYRSGTTIRTDYNRRANNRGATGIKYYNTSGVVTYTNTSYGLYGSLQTPSFSSSTSTSNTYVYVGSPTLYARYSSSYETADNMKLVTECVWDWDVRVYRVDKSTSDAYTIYKEIESLLNIYE